MFSRIRSMLFSRSVTRPVTPVRRMIRARYDAALTTDNNRRHWLNADGLSANTANAPSVRRTLRNRSRYEVANNSYARGIILTLANDCIGTGPRLQMLSATSADNARIERAFASWTAAVNLAEKLRTMRMAKAEDGEAFALLTNNPLVNHPVKLDLRLVEADQIATPGFGLPRANKPNAVDGIVLDSFGNPLEYHVLRQHPGERLCVSTEFDRIPATDVLHFFRTDRPGQNRGVPEITAALPLFAMLREYSLATLDAAKAAAYFAGVLYTDAPANGEAENVEPMDRIELERNTLMTMPGGWKIGQVDAKQPASTYAEFKKEILNEIARCIGMPFSIAAGNSSGMNYSSGRLDHSVYFKSLRIEQAFLATSILDRLLAAWIAEAVLVEGLLPQPMRATSADWSHQWFWDGHEHVDPQKEATAQATRLQSHTTTLAEEYARRGRDWEAELTAPGLSECQFTQPCVVCDPRRVHWFLRQFQRGMLRRLPKMRRIVGNPVLLSRWKRSRLDPRHQQVQPAAQDRKHAVCRRWELSLPARSVLPDRFLLPRGGEAIEMSAWTLKEDRVIDVGRVATLEYEGRELYVLVHAGKDLDAVISDYGQRLVEIVEGAKKESDYQAKRLAEVHAGAPDPKQLCGCMEKINRTKAGKTLGVVSLGKALLGGTAPPGVAQARLAICQACQATDQTGARLYRMLDGKAYCGAPRLSDLRNIYRDETNWGCGCELGWKAVLTEARCPLGQW